MSGSCPFERKMHLKVSEIDLKIFNCIFNYRREVILPRFFRVISFIGDGYFYPLLLLLILREHPDMFRRAFIMTLIGFGIEFPFYKLLKFFIKRDRPFNTHDIENVVFPIDEYSFPSGHTTAAFLVAFIAIIYLPVFAAVLYFFAFLVGVSRIYLGVHYPGDIFGGAILGTFI